MEDTPMSDESSDLDLDQIRWQETVQAIESVEQGRVISSEAVHAWLASWGSPNELPPPSC